MTSRTDMIGLPPQADDSVDEEVLNHYCWMFSQFDIPPDFKVSSVR